MVALRKSSWLRLVSCSAASEMLALPWPVFRRTLRLMLPTSLRQSCPEPVAPAPDALPAPPPPPPPWVGASWPSDDFAGLCSRLDRRLRTPRPSLAADADTVPLTPGPATGCEPPGQPFTASVPSAPANLSTGPPPLGPVAPPWPNEPIAYRPIPLLMLNLRTRFRRALLCCFLGSSSGLLCFGVSALWPSWPMK